MDFHPYQQSIQLLEKSQAPWNPGWFFPIGWSNLHLSEGLKSNIPWNLFPLRKTWNLQVSPKVQVGRALELDHCQRPNRLVGSQSIGQSVGRQSLVVSGVVGTICGFDGFRKCIGDTFATLSMNPSIGITSIKHNIRTLAFKHSQKCTGLFWRLAPKY